MPEIALLILLALLTAGLLWVASRIFRHGARRRFISDIPFWKLLLWSVGFQLMSAALDWFLSDSDAKPLFERMAVGAVVFAGAAAVWFAGFAFGRWRDSRRAGVLSNTR